MLDSKSRLVLKILAKESSGGSYKIFESSDIISALPKHYRTDSEGINHILTHLGRQDMIHIKYDDDDVYCLAVLPYGFEALENVNSPKVVHNKNRNALYFSRSIIPYQRNAAKEDWLENHTYYKHIGLYAYRVEVLKEITALPQSSLEIAESLEQLRWLENGYTIKAGITDVETIGIDTPQDLERAEEFLKSHGL